MWQKIWQSKYFFWTIFLLAMGIRVYGASTEAQSYDIGTYHAWGNHLLEVGPRHFFDNIWSDYLPLPILTFAVPAWISQILHLNFSLVFKLFHSLIEVILILVLGQTLGKSFRWIVFLLLLSPVLIGDTSFWGQVDSLPSLLALLSLSRLLTPGVKGAHTPGVFIFAILYGLSVAYKPIMILIAPVIWITSLKKGESWWKLPFLSSLVFFASALPTGGWSFISHMLSRIFDQAGTYPFLTINAWNLWSLVPIGSWIPDATNVFGLSGHTLGLIIFSLFVLFALNSWRKTKFDSRYAFRVATTILIAFYTFTTRMHERHLLFGLPFIAIAAYYQRFLLYPFILYTLCFILNLYSAFYWVAHAQTWPLPEFVTVLVSWFTVLTTCGLTFIWDWSQTLKSGFLRLKSNKLLVGILFLATILRFSSLTHPPVYIFDEVYHAFTGRQYLHNHKEAWEWWTTPPEGVAYEWTHPPVAKYGMVLGMLLFGENSYGWRVGSSIFGVISILGLYSFTYALLRRKDIALLTAFLVSIEGLHIVQSRIAMNDIYMLAFLIWALFAAVKSRWKSAAILYGLSLASKWSAIYGLVPLALIYLHNPPIAFSNLKFYLTNLFSIFRLLLIVILVYILTFTPFILAGHTWGQWWELHRQMWYYHTHLVATHAYQSTPWQWLFAVRPVWYYVKYLGDNIENIYAQGNPLILWLGLVALILQLKKIFQFPYLILYTLYFILTVPWLLSPRIMFFYHYLPSSTFLCVIFASWLLTLPKKYFVTILILTSGVLLLISPMLYGFATPHLYWDTLFKIFPSWK
ncbi:MAG: glycosyltransferase family 39 protein [bacterium]